MKKIIEVFVFVCLFIWQLPQNILALILIVLNGDKYKGIEHKRFISTYIFSDDLPFSGVSLGCFILLSQKVIRSDKWVKLHETGHCIQSLFTGWLYLIIIGIPSFINNRRAQKDKQYKKDYYKKYPEKNADWWSGVVR